METERWRERLDRERGDLLVDEESDARTDQPIGLRAGRDAARRGRQGVRAAGRPGPGAPPHAAQREARAGTSHAACRGRAHELHAGEDRDVGCPRLRERER